MAYTKVMNLYAERIMEEDKEDDLSELIEILLQQIPVKDLAFFTLNRGTSEKEQPGTFNEVMCLLCNRYEDIIKKDEETKNYRFISPYRKIEIENNILDRTKAAYADQLIVESNFEDMIDQCEEERSILVDFLIDKLEDNYEKQMEGYMSAINAGHPQWKEAVANEMKEYGYDKDAVHAFVNDIVDQSFVENLDNK